MGQLLRVPKVHSLVLTELAADIRREALALGRFADRARAVSFRVLGDDLRATQLRLAGLADRLESIVRRSPAEPT